MPIRHIVCLFSATGLLIGSAQGATLLWGDAKPIAGDQDVLNTGTRHYAYRFGGSTALSTTVNGVAFDRVSPITTAGTYSIQLASGRLGFSTSDDAENNGRLSAAALQAPATGRFLTLSSEYQALLGAVAYNAATNDAYFIHLNQLTQGQSYRVQIWANESRAPRGVGHSMVDGVRLDTNDTNSEGGVGQYLTGYFVADATTQIIEIGKAQYVNGISVYAVPEPSNLAWVGLLTTLCFFGKRRRGKA